jgi:hypothetical protein
MGGTCATPKAAHVVLTKRAKQVLARAAGEITTVDYDEKKHNDKARTQP